MSKITNDDSTRSVTGCFLTTHIATVGVKGLTVHANNRTRKPSYRWQTNRAILAQRSCGFCTIVQLLNFAVFSDFSTPSQHPCTGPTASM